MMEFVHDFKKYPEMTNTQLQESAFMSPFPQITEDFRAKVVKVHDGDTITVRTDFRDFDFPVRFLNIDAPELNAGGETARDWLISRIEGQMVDVLIDPENRVGKYGRLLGRVFHLGTDVGLDEINLGLALPFSNRREGQIPDINKELRVKQWLSM